MGNRIQQLWTSREMEQKKDKYVLTQMKEQDGTIIKDAKHITTSSYSTIITRQKTQMEKVKECIQQDTTIMDNYLQKTKFQKDYITKVETDKRHNNSINNKNYDNPTGAIADQDGMVYTVGYKWSWANGK